MFTILFNSDSSSVLIESSVFLVIRVTILGKFRFRTSPFSTNDSIPTKEEDMSSSITFPGSLGPVYSIPGDPNTGVTICPFNTLVIKFLPSAPIAFFKVALVAALVFSVSVVAIPEYSSTNLETWFEIKLVVAALSPSLSFIKRITFS